MSEVYFVSGIDTHIGKTFATGFLARQWQDQGYSVITQKLIQTGNTQYSEDIEQHRKMMGIPLQPMDHDHTTMPEIYAYPASPHLAARLEGRTVNFEHIQACTARLQQYYDRVLLEGAGGLMVPITEDVLMIDYIAQQHYPIILVTSGRLGSINHTLLSLEAILARGLKLHAIAYNLKDESQDPIISTETARYLKTYVARHFDSVQWIDIPAMD